MEVRELRYFVAVAEELNFTRAAARLGIAQPPLSRAISGLERRLGARLLERDSRGVSLTPAGEVLLSEARTVLDAVAAAGRRTGRATKPLVVTAKPGTATAILKRIAFDFDILVSGYGDQGDLVRDGRADVALVGSPFDPRGLDTEPLTAEPRVAALPLIHPLARLEELRLADLAGQPFARWLNETPRDRAYWCGPSPLEGPRVADVAQLLEVVSLGQAMALVPQSVADANPRADLAYRPVVDAEPYVIAAAWPADSRDRHIARFVAALHQADDQVIVRDNAVSQAR